VQLHDTAAMARSRRDAVVRLEWASLLANEELIAAAPLDAVA